MSNEEWPVVEPFSAVDLEPQYTGVSSTEIVSELKRNMSEADIAALGSLTISEEGYIEVDPTTQSEHAFKFVSTINKMLPSAWSGMYKGEVDLVNPQVHGGKMERARMLPLSSGLDGNRLAFLLTGQINGHETNEAIVAQTHILAADRIIELMRSEELTDVQRRQAAKLALHVFTPLVRLYELPELMQQLQDNAFSLLDPAGYVRVLTEWREEFWEPVNGTELIQTLREEFASALGIPEEAITVDYRLKSLLSYAQKRAEGRSKHDWTGCTVRVDDSYLPELERVATGAAINEPDNEHSFGRVGKQLISAFNGIASSLQLFESDNAYVSLKDYNPDYRVVNTICLIPSLHHRPMEIRVVSSGQHARNIVNHPWYKMMI